MKKAVVFGLALVGSTAYAQSLQLYGLVDAGVSRMSGLSGGSVTQLNSGIMEGSRWGLRGREDLGGGYQAIFTLESRFEVDTGSVTNRPVTGTQLPDRVSTPAALGLPDTPVTRATVTAIGTQLANAEFGVNIPGRLFDRQAFVGLITPFGAILAGRQYTPAFEVAAQFDIFNLASAASPQQLVAFPTGVDIRVSNSVAYRIEKNGFTGSIVAAPGEKATNFGHFIGAGGMYKSDRFSAGLAHNTRKNELGDKSLTNTVAGASLNLGSGTLSTEINMIKDDNPAGLSALPAAPLNFQAAFFSALRQDARLFHIGYRRMFGANSLAVGYNHLDDKRPSNADVASYGAAYTYVLSKRTDLTAAVAHLDNKERGQLALGGNGFLGGVSERAGRDVNNVSFSIRHRF